MHSPPQAANLVLLVAACGGGGDGGVATVVTSAAAPVTSGGTATTAAVADTYSLGAISGFGSIVVGGVRYDDSSASVSDEDGISHNRSALKLGMTVQVDAGAVTRSSVAGSASATSVAKEQSALAVKSSARWPASTALQAPWWCWGRPSPSPVPRCLMTRSWVACRP